MSSSTGINPFPGIRPFDIQEKYLFFGREDQTAELLTRLRKTRFLAVVGSSGSGKSSLVRAGLIPELHGGTMAAAGSSWEVAVMKPGGDPLTNLAKSLVESDLYDPDQEDVLPMIRAALSRSGMGLVDAVQQSDLEPKTNLLLVVDQFEEIFRFRRMTGISEEEAGHFIRLLLEASQQETCPIYVVLTMRSDFLGDCAQFGGLAEAVNEGEYIIPRLNRSQRKQAIEAPARVGGREMSNRLVQRLLNDISDDPDQLPILQHALMRTWDYWVEAGSEGPVDLEHYQATGGMAEALSRHADEVFESLPDEEHRRIATKLFKSLTEKVSENRGIRRPMQLNELHEICGGEMDHLLHVIHEFRKTGCTFLMPAGESELQKHTIIDISHESLMRVWRTLRLWVDDEAQSAKIYRRLADTASLFKDAKAGLYRDPDLGIALAWRDANQPNQTWADRYYPGFTEAMAFLDKSQAEEEREAKEKEEARKRELAQAQALAKAKARTAVIFKLASVSLFIFGIVALYLFIVAKQNQRLAEVKTQEAENSLITQAKRSQAVGRTRSMEGKTGQAAAWFADGIKLSTSDKDLQKQLIEEFVEETVSSPKLAATKKFDTEVLDVWTGKNEIVVLTEKTIYWCGENLEKIKLKHYSETPVEEGIITKDGKFAFYTTKDRNLEKVNIYTGITSLVAEAKENGRFELKAAAKNGKGNLIGIPYYGSENSIHIHDSETEKTFSTITSERALAFSLSNEGKLYLINQNQSDSSSFSVYDFSESSLKEKNLTTEIIGQHEVIKSGNGWSQGKLGIITSLSNNSSLVTLISDDKPTKEPGHILPGYTDNIHFSNDLKNLYYITTSGQIAWLNIEHDSTTKTFGSNYKELQVSPDGNSIVALNENNNIEFVDPHKNWQKAECPIVFSDPLISYAKNCQSIYVKHSDNYVSHIIKPTIDHRNARGFMGRKSPLKLQIFAKKAYSNYEFSFPQLASKNADAFQLSEIEIISEGQKLDTASIKSILATGEVDSPKGEEADKLFDGKISTKHVSFETESPGVVVELGNPIVIDQVILYSGNDVWQRDPATLKLKARNHDSTITIWEGPLISSDFQAEKTTLSTSLSGIFENNNFDAIEDFAKHVTGCTISSNGTISTATADELTNWHGSMRPESNYLKSLTSGSQEWHLRSIFQAHAEVQPNGITFHNPMAITYHFDFLTPENRNLTAIQNFYATSQFQQHFTAEAIETIETLIIQQPDNLSAIYDLCIFNIAINNYTAANEAFAKYVSSPIFGQNLFWDNNFRGLYYNSPIESKAYLESSKTQFEVLKNDAESLLGYEKTYSSIPNSAVFDIHNEITIQLWLKNNDIRPISGRIIGNQVHWSSSGYGIEVGYNNLFFNLANNQSKERNAITVNLTQFDFDSWNLITANWDKKTSTMRLYINKSLVAEGFFKGPIGSSKLPLLIGKHPLGGWFANACISDIGIWDYSFSMEDIAQSFDYPETFDQIKRSAIAYWVADPSKQQFTSLFRPNLSSKIISGELVSPSGHGIDNKPYAVFRNLGFGDEVKFLLKQGKYNEVIARVDKLDKKVIPDKLNHTNYFSRESIDSLVLLALAYSESGKPQYAKLFVEQLNSAENSQVIIGDGNFRNTIRDSSLGKYAMDFVSGIDDQL